MSFLVRRRMIDQPMNTGSQQVKLPTTLETQRLAVLCKECQ
jgi:hypothetical protein